MNAGLDRDLELQMADSRNTQICVYLKTSYLPLAVEDTTEIDDPSVSTNEAYKKRIPDGLANRIYFGLRADVAT